MLKKDYAKLVVKAESKIESMYACNLDYEQKEAFNAAISALGLSEKDFKKIQDESWK